ncbi:HNH endonuclease signature motif containing protein [Streptomyces antarcticus]|uniref:HNH endonuclease signature motif containing protein n=2 Tax=Streptomyces antarcticus TaxID=2996458 RepID=UPI0022706831|nr:HNH endonuclease signature motif containing protein [Streptomyces sp. H34-AA3]MCY0940522.1 HNH endonuclease signature motif containing protein [Streptomyces sp. H34-AA3]MCZ4082359.1 HNH endonuclease signature motif containing protein [Streptomyces sp. H34-S5]
MRAMFTDFEDESFRPAGAQHVVCGAIPAGFGAPVYVDGAEGQRDAVLRQLLLRYPARQRGLRTAVSLNEAGLRPANLFRPDGYVLGPPETVVVPGYDSGRKGPAAEWTETVFRPSAVYDERQALPLSTAPEPEQVDTDRRAAAAWAEEVLMDPRAVILAVNAIGSLAPDIESLARATPYEIALTSTTGRKRWHQLINPGWDDSYLEQLDLRGAELKDLQKAPAFRDVRDELTRRIAGRRVIIHGRNLQYAALYTAFEFAVFDDALPEGTLWLDTADILESLARTRWECAQLRHAEFEGEWDGAQGHYVLPSLPMDDADVLERCRATVSLLRRMAAPALRYAELNDQAERMVRRGGSHQLRALSGTRLSRISASRRAVLERSGGACENPACPDPRYTSARSRNGSYLLEVDHVDDHAKGGEDLPRSMIALCPNCHAIKTRTAVSDQFRELLRSTALDRHLRLLREAEGI